MLLGPALDGGVFLEVAAALLACAHLDAHEGREGLGDDLGQPELDDYEGGREDLLTQRDLVWVDCFAEDHTDLVL
jgi:hypothetical protein